MALFQLAGGEARDALIERSRRAIEKGVTKGSSQQYDRQWRRWTGFLQLIPYEWRPSELLREVSDRDEKVLYLTAFIDYLIMDLEVKGHKEVSEVISGVRFKWACEGLGSEFFEDHRVKAAKKGGRLTTQEMRAQVDKSNQNRKIPACKEMLVWIREEYWKEDDYDAEASYNKGVYLAAALSYDTGARPGNVRRVDGKDKEDHCIRAGDMEFEVEHDGATSRLSGGEQIRSFLVRMEGEAMRVNRERLNRVKSVRIRIVTSKTHNKMKAPINAFEIGRGNVHEDMLLSDLCSFMVVSGVMADNPFCSRYAVDKKGSVNMKTVTAKDLTTAVKRSAAALGLPVKHFSSKSLRSGFASQMSACQVPRAHFLTRGGWSTKSDVPNKHYIHQNVRGAFSTLADREGVECGLSLSDIQSFVPVGKGQAVGGAKQSSQS